MISFIKKTFKKVFPEPTEEQWHKKNLKLILKFEKMEHTQKTKEQYEVYEKNLNTAHKFLNMTLDIPVGNRTPAFKVNVAFLKYSITTDKYYKYL